MLQVLGLVGGTQHVGVGGVGLFGAHLVAETFLRHEGRHFGAAAQLVDEGLVKPRLVDLQGRVGQQAVAVEALDVIALEGGAVAPDVDVVFLHGGHQHGAGHGAAQRRGVEVGDAAGADVEGAGLDGGNAFIGQLRAAVDQASLLCTVFQGLAGDGIVVFLVGLAEIGGVGIGQGALVLHPAQGRAGVQAAGEGDADLLADGNVLQDGFHGVSLQNDRGWRLTGLRQRLKKPGMAALPRSGLEAAFQGLMRSGRCSGRPRSRGCRTWSLREPGSVRRGRIVSTRRYRRAGIRKNRPRIP